jgi:hypothetical protein
MEANEAAAREEEERDETKPAKAAVNLESARDLERMEYRGVMD